jgi:hypothetical protein
MKLLPFTCARSVRIFLLLIFVCPNLSYSQVEDAAAYLSAINAEYGKISKEVMDYISAANHGRSARKVEKRRSELALQLKESEKAIRKMKPFKGGFQLRDSIASYFRMSHHVINEDYGKIVDMEEIAEQSYDAMEAYMLAKELASDKMDKAHEVAQVEYKSFAAANNIRLIEGDSKLGDRIRAAGLVNSYHQKFYLLFFKSYKNEAYLMEALNKGNVGAMEQTRNALASSAEGDLAKIGPMQGFKGDLSLKNATQQILFFYKSEAAQMPSLIEYYLAKEEFEKIKKGFDSKKQSDRTQEDIDQYNKAINDFNSKVKKSNQVNEELNKKRNTLLKNWNDTSEAFLHKHTP